MARTRPPAQRPEHRDDYADKPRRLRRSLAVTAMVLAPLLLLAGLVVGLGYVRLLHGPVSLKFLVDPIQRGIAAEFVGLEARIDDAVVALTDRGLEFRLRNLRLTEADGEVVASAPAAAARISGKALWDFRIVPARVELIEPQLAVFYSEETGLVLSLQSPDEIVERRDAAKPANPAASDEPSPEFSLTAAFRRLDLARAIADATARARKRIDASSYLREIGMRNATVVFDHSGRRSVWKVPEVDVDLVHKRTRSVIAAEAKIETSRGPFTIAMRTEDSEKTRTVKLKTSVRNLVPRTLSQALPQLSLLETLDMPVSADATLELSGDGQVTGGTLAVHLGQGRLFVPAFGAAPFDLDQSLLSLSYDGAARRFDMAPSSVSWGGSRITLTGSMAGGQSVDGKPAWQFNVRATDGMLSAEEFGVSSVALDTWVADGRLVPQLGMLQLNSFKLKAGGAEVSARGEIDTRPDTAGTRLEGTLSPMPLPTLKVVWPKALAADARNWVGKHVTRANLLGGTFRFVSGSYFRREDPGSSDNERLTLAIEAADARAYPIDNMSPIDAPRVTTKIERGDLEISVPDAAIVLGSGRRVPLKGGRFFVPDVDSPTPPVGEITFRSQTPLAPALEFLDQPPLSLVHTAGLPADKIEGKVDGQFKITLPLVKKLDPSSLKIEGQARVTDARAKDLIGAYDMQSATINVDVRERAVEAQGEMLLSGVLAKLNWQRIFDAPPEKQPPLRLTATLDGSDRNQLGLDVNNLVHGDVPIEITVTPGHGDEPAVHLRADLTNAELEIDGVAWRKPPGRTAYLECDVVRGQRTELQNFKISGDDIAVSGSLVLGPDNSLREFAFPEFSLNVVTRLEVHGKVRNDQVWEVKARGPTFDGRDMFRSLVTFGQAGTQTKPLSRTGINFEGDVGNVIGFGELGLRGVTLKLQKRGDKLTGLEGRGALDGNQLVTLSLRQGPSEPRRIIADATDAGQALRLIGFYPNVQGGRLRLELNLDGKGAAEKTGSLYLESFRILGDPVVTEVLSSTGEPTAGGGRAEKRRVVREVIDFDTMRAPFSIGHGQFVLEDANLKGPLLGATIRGKVDYRSQTMRLGGTYIPLQGLNNVLGEVPLLGQLLSGPRGEGIFGITFAIQGPINNPQVIVNPLSLVTPGIFREIFQMTPIDPRVQAPREGGKTGGTAPTPAPSKRASSGSDKAAKGAVDGWTSGTTETTETSEAPGPRKK